MISTASMAHQATSRQERSVARCETDLVITEVAPGDRAAWQAYVHQREHSTFVDSWHWRDVLERSYELPCHWLAARRDGAIRGVLALTLTRHPLLGTYLTTAPFANYGGFHYDSRETAMALLDAAAALRRRLRANHVNVRHLDADAEPPEGWQQEAAYATYWLPLSKDAEALRVDHFRASLRRLINKSQQNGFRISFGAEALLDDFWYVITRSMKELGSPYHRKSYLRNILSAFGAQAFLAVAYSREGEPFGGSLLLIHNGAATQLHGNILNRFRGLYPGEFLYWSVIAECCRRGLSRLDLGRSLVGSGNEIFKMKWRPMRRELAYWYRLRPGRAALPSLHQGNPRYRLAIKTWRRLPLWVQARAGPRLITGIL